MSKGQKRSSRETRKPKADKPATPKGVSTGGSTVTSVMSKASPTAVGMPKRS